MTPPNAETGHGKTHDSGQRGKGQWLELFLVQTHTLNFALLHKAMIAQEFVWSQYHDRVNVLFRLVTVYCLDKMLSKCTAAPLLGGL